MTVHSSSTDSATDAQVPAWRRGVTRFLRITNPAHNARLFSIADQGFQGLGGLIATALLGRALPRLEFGHVGIMIGLYFVVHGFHRSAVILPYLTEHQSWDTPEEERRYHSDWWWLSTLISLLLSLIMMGTALAGQYFLPSSSHWLTLPLFYCSMLTPPMLVMEFGRRWLFQRGEAQKAALLSALFFVALVGSALFVSAYRPDAVGGALSWTVAALVSVLFTVVVLRPMPLRWHQSVECFKRHRRFALWLVLTILPYTIYSNATIVILIGAMIGSEAAAIFTACRTLTNPAISLVSAIDSLDKPKAARAYAQVGISGLRCVVGQTRLLLFFVTGGYLAIVALFAYPLLQLVFHGNYPGVGQEVQLLTLAFFMICMNQPSETMLIVLRASKMMFMTRLATAAVTLLALHIAAPYGVAGMAVAIIISLSANLLALLLAEQLVLRRMNNETAPPPIGQGIAL